MSVDISKKTFNPIKDFAGVLMQQGRVQLDSGWNEMMDILDRRWRAETIDIIGRSMVPKETPDGFRITLSGGKIQIGQGRMYVDGLLAENHGKPPYSFAPTLAELESGTPLGYDEQPYLPNSTFVAPQPTSGGAHLVYLDVWQREVSHLEDPELLEKAVGVDTTGRTQTVWQVKVLKDVGSGVTCDTPDEQITSWQQVIRPSSGRLSTGTVAAPDDDLCLIPPGGDYLGLENRLYRVEIHEGGAPGTAKFKWSRDNGSVATRVTAIPTLEKLAVEETMRDAYMRFSPGDWVEITDDWREFAGLSGEIRQVKSVDDDARTITLESGLSAGLFPTDAQNKTDPDRHTRLRRWDQSGVVLDTNDVTWVDLDAAASDGLITVPTAGTELVLEHGITVDFDVEQSAGEFDVGDYWVFAARTTDASVEILDEAPPEAIHHHYARLALVDFPATVTDCRTLWPPDFGGSCDCSVCVSAESHNSGAATIQWAIDQAKEEGGIVCLKPGAYNLGDSPILIDGAQSLRVHGQGWRTFLLYGGEGPAIVVQNSIGVTIEDLALVTSGQSKSLSADLLLRNLAGVTVQRCLFVQAEPGEDDSPAIGLAGLLLGARLRENVIAASSGIASLAHSARKKTAEYEKSFYTPAGLPLLAGELFIEKNLIFSRERGVSLDGFSVHAGETRIEANSISGAQGGAIVALGWTLPGSGIDISDNELRPNGPGIVVGIDGARVHDNDLSPGGDARRADGIVLAPGLLADGVDFLQIFGNRITDLSGTGILLSTNIDSGMIKNNVLKGLGLGGIVMTARASAGALSVENNQLLDIALNTTTRAVPIFGVRLLNVKQAEITSNTLRGIGSGAVVNPYRAGIQVAASESVRIAGNEVVDIGPSQFVGYTAGIHVFTPFERADVVDNVVRRSRQSPGTPDTSNWYALLIAGPSFGAQGHKMNINRGSLMAWEDKGGSGSSNQPGNENAEVSEESMFNIETHSMIYALDDSVGLIWTNLGIWGFFGDTIARLPRSRETVGIRGNLFEAYGGVPAVAILGEGAFIFSENRCSLMAANVGGMKVGPTLAIIGAGALIANANYLEGPGGSPALRIELPEIGPYTVSSNIASGAIQVNGAGLDATWAPLNAIAS